MVWKLRISLNIELRNRDPVTVIESALIVEQPLPKQKASTRLPSRIPLLAIFAENLVAIVNDNTTRLLYGSKRL